MQQGSVSVNECRSGRVTRYFGFTIDIFHCLTNPRFILLKIILLAPEAALEATIRMSDKCREIGQARGNLLPLLHDELNFLLDDDVHEVFNSREGYVGLAYREIFPQNKPVLGM